MAEANTKKAANTVKKEKKEVKKVNAEAKKEVKKEKVKEVEEKKSEVKKEVKKPKVEKPKGEIKKKRKELKAVLRKIKKKSGKKIPSIRGRFGQRPIRKISNKKWQRWRKPRGIDIRRHQQDGAWPKTGYKTDSDIRGMHPSGYFEVYVSNVKELKEVDNKFAVRIKSKVGKKTRIEIRKEAEKLDLKILNPR